MIYLVTGWPGAGKSTVTVQHAIYRYACAGRRVVANFPIDFSPVCVRRDSQLSKAAVQVLPDRPTRADLDAIGDGGEREETAGMVAIDEAGGWLNARTWQGHDRESIIDWLTQSRKRFWDVFLIAQAPTMLDKQVREAVCELVVRIRRLDRWKVWGVSMPRFHIAVVRYGLDHNGPIVERWYYRGSDVHKCFGSYRLFGVDSAHYSVLPASQVKWRDDPVRVKNGVGAVLSVVGIAGAVLAAAAAFKFGMVWMLGCALLARFWGYDVTPKRPFWWVRRLRRWSGFSLAGSIVSLRPSAHGIALRDAVRSGPGEVRAFRRGA